MTSITFDSQLVDYFKAAEKRGLIDQSEPTFYAGFASACCVGAHLANYLLNTATVDKQRSFQEGIDAWAAKIGGNRLHAIRLLRDAGANHNPFNALSWELPPSKVFAKLAAVETLPDLSSYDFSDCWLPDLIATGECLAYSSFVSSTLTNANLENADLTECDFSNATADYADFSDTQLQAAQFRYADVSHSFFRKISAENADFSNAFAYSADFSHAELEKANFSVVDLSKSDFTDAYLVGADFTGANLTQANFTGANLTAAKFADAIMPDTDFTATKFNG